MNNNDVLLSMATSIVLLVVQNALKDANARKQYKKILMKIHDSIELVYPPDLEPDGPGTKAFSPPQ